MVVCTNCGNQAGEGAVFCDQCGARLPGPEAAAPAPAATPTGGSVICTACGAGNVPGEAFCDYCGSPLEAPAPTAEAVPELEPVSTEVELEVAPEPVVEEEAQPEPVAEEAAPPAEAPAIEEPALSKGEEGVRPEEVAVPEPAPEPVAPLACPVCGEEVQPDEAFCANCGASLAQPPIPPEPVPELEDEPEPAVTEPAPEPIVEEAPSPPPPTCPACGAEVEAGDTFCSNCGAALQEVPMPEPEPALVEAAPPPPPPLAGPRLVVVASGAEIPLPASAEILIGREDPVSGVYPDVDLTPHGGEEGGVSRRHARLLVEGGDYFVEDLDSTNFTFVNKQKIAPKIRQKLSNGDELRCGRVALVLRTG